MIVIRAAAFWRKIFVYLITVATTTAFMCMIIINKGVTKTSQTPYAIISVPLRDTLNKNEKPSINIARLKIESGIKKKKGSDTQRETIAETQRNSASDGKDRAYAQINKRLLIMIEEIEQSDTTIKGKITQQDTLNFTCPRQLRIIDGIEDLLCMEPPNFLSKYKNPCWNSSKGRLQCLPYFQLIGMDKCGSTDLFDRIAKHPDVLKNNGLLGKETMWWSWKRYGHTLKHDKKIKPFAEYVKYFDSAAEAIMSQPEAGIITGDGTPMDIWDMSGWVKIPQNYGLKEPKILTPHLIKHVNPNVKLIVILRNPVERLFSDYFFLKIGRQSLRAFHAEVIKSITTLHSCTRKYSLRRCLYSRNLHVRSNARIHLGFYSIFLKDWLGVFPREQFLLMKTEDYSNKTKDHLRQAFSFLGLRNLSETALQLFADTSRKHVTKNKKKAGKMYEKTRVILERLYKNFNTELVSVLKDKRFNWNHT